MSKEEHIVIIGNGIAGVTTARHIRKRSRKKITIVSAESPYFFSRTALMYVYMGHMKFEHTQPYENGFWAKNNIDLLQAYIKEVDFEKQVLHTADGQQLAYDKLVLATGSKPNKFGWKGQDLPGVQGLYSKQDLELLEENTHPFGTKGDQRKVKRAVIVGGGLIGVELAEMLIVRNIEVTFLIRESKFWGNVLPPEEGELVKRHMLEHGVDLRFESELDEVVAGEDGRCTAVLTKGGERIDCQLVGLTAGVSPNIDFVKNSALDCDRGIRVNLHLETNMPNVYALGDCVQFIEAPKGRRNIEQVWYTGRMMGETLALTLTDEKTAYQPGFWFNSAKFFDIEYQTYGTVSANLEEENDQFYWEDESGKRCFKMVFDKANGILVGINIFGIRMRHVVVDGWLKENRKVDHVIAHLKDAMFDPEFYKPFEKPILAKFNEVLPQYKAQPKPKSWKRILQFSK